MDDPIDFRDTIEERIALIARTVLQETRARDHDPDTADFRQAFRAPLRQEVLFARIEEARVCGRGDRLHALTSELARLQT